MFFRLILASLGRQKRKKLVLVAAIALGMAVVTAQLAIVLDVADRMNEELKTFGANIQVIPKGDNLTAAVGSADISAFKSGRFIDEASLVKLKQVFWKNNIIDFAPFLPVAIPLHGRTVTLMGTWFNHTLSVGQEGYTTGADRLFKFWKVDGRYPLADNEVVAGRRLAEELGLRAGAILPPGVTVVGILTTGGEEDGQIVGRIGLAQSIAGLPGAVKNVQISALTTPETAAYARLGQNPRDLPAAEFEAWYCTPFVSSIAFQLAEALPGTEAFVIRQVADAEGKVVTRMEALIALISLVAVLSSGLAVMSTMMTAVYERRSEVGLMKALGATNAGVVAAFVSEAFILALIGGIGGYVLGMILGTALAQTVFGIRMTWKLVLLPIAVSGAVVITALGSAIPFGNILRFEPIRVLRQS